jgi:hypothetical protein
MYTLAPLGLDSNRTLLSEPVKIEAQDENKRIIEILKIICFFILRVY